MCFEQFGFICRFSSLGTLTCLWKPGVCSLPLHAAHNLCRKANPHFSSSRELSENLVLQNSLVSQYCRGDRRALVGKLWSIGRKMLASEMWRTELCCQQRKGALPVKQQPQHKALSTHYPAWIMKSWCPPFTLCHLRHIFVSQEAFWTRLFWQRYPHMSLCGCILSHSLPPDHV